jgi:hypothetical protein
LVILPENYRAVSLTWGRNPAPRRAVSDSDQKPAVRNRTLLYRKLQAGRNRHWGLLPPPIRPRSPKAPPAITPLDPGQNPLGRSPNTPQKRVDAFLRGICEPAQMGYPPPILVKDFLPRVPSPGGYYPGNDFLKKISRQGILTRGYRSPIPGFASWSRKRGT